MNGSRVRMGGKALLVAGVALVLTIALTACSTSNGPTTTAPAVAAGNAHSLALLSDGSVWAWGNNDYGDLGNGSAVGSNTPVQVLGPNGTGTLSGITAIAGGYDHSLALKSDGSVWAWGGNSAGQLGNATSGGSSNTPVQVAGPTGSGELAGITAIAAGRDFSLALKSDGSVWAWGIDNIGQLGNGSAGESDTPVQVVGFNDIGTLADITAIAAGNDFALALKSDGSVWAWGGNTYGALGNGSTVSFGTPVQVLGPNGTGTLSGITAIAAGGNDFALALKSDGSVWAWGNDGYGALGNGSASGSELTPVQVLGPSGTGTLANVTAITAGTFHALAVLSDGSVCAWGNNSAGELGNGATSSDSDAPVQVLGPGGTGTLSGITASAAGNGFSLALNSDGSVWAWGYDAEGQLGDGTTTSYTDAPVEVQSLP